MKKITFIIVAVVIASMSFGQNSFIDQKSKTNSKTRALSSNKPFKESSTNKMFAKSTKGVGATIFSSNFSNLAEWTIDNEAGNSDNWVIGTNGPTNYMDAIASTTAANGFALFDSDFLCSGNQNAYLTTATSFDCSAYAVVNLKFETFYKKHQENGIFVQVSNNGTEWSNFQIFAEYTQGNQSENPTTLDIDISSAAGNEATVWVRFKFLSISNGCDYAWMIDDVVVYEAVETISTFPFIETFEDDSPTRGSWTQIQEIGTGSWTFATGAGNGSITSAYEGSLNARFTASQDGNITKLVSPLMDLTALTNPQLVFWYGQGNWGTQNELKIYYRTDVSGSWVEFVHYTDDVNVWTKELLSLPNPSSTYQIAFEGIDNYGFANVIDYLTVSETTTNIVDWCNLQQPGTATIFNTETFNVYAQVLENGVTDADANAAGIGIECWIGYNDANTNPATWTNWIPATYNQDVEVKDEFIATLGTFNSGTYYYASRFRYQEGFYSYGGYTSTGGGEWNGTTNVSGVLTVNSTLGGDCSNPFIVNIPADLPYADISQTNCGLGYNYNNTSISDPNYDDGEDAIYQIILASDAIIRIALNPKTALYTSISLFNDCPDIGALLDEFYDSYNIWREIEISLPTGTYYLMIDTWASPDCIPDYDLTIEAVCITPSGIEEINLTQTSADIQWTAGNLETSWNIKVNESNPIDPFFELGDIVANAEVLDNPIYSIETGLTLDTDYYVYVKAACGYEWATYMFTTPTACPVPTGLTATVINANNATLTWNKLGMSDWIIKVSTISLSDPENETADIDNNTAVTGGVAQYNLSDLSMEIIYYWYVKSACGSDWSAENVFTTACDPSLIPFTEDFTGVTAGNLPNCWNKSHINWSVSETSDAGGSSPELMLNWNPEVTDDIIVYLPTIDATSNSNLAMSFIHFVDYYENSFDLRLDYTIDNGETWNTAWDITNVNSNITSEEVHIDLSSFVDGEVFKLAFVFSGYTHDINYWYIDNINIFEKNVIDQIDIYSDINDIFLCVGEDEAIAMAKLPPQMTISDTNGDEYLIDLTWTIDSYNGLIPYEYNATGIFTLPSNIEQTAVPTPLEVTAIVTVNDPEVITFSFNTFYCIGAYPDELPTTSDNNITGTWSPDIITSFAIGNKDYTFTPDAGECTDVDSMIITVTVQYPTVTTFSFQTTYCVGDTPDELPTTSDDNYTGAWNPATISTDTVSDTVYTFTPDVGECVLLTTISVSVSEVPVVTCPNNFTITETGIITLSGATPTGGTYSGTGITDNNFDPSSLSNGDYTITYTYPNTGCSNSCDFTITVNIVNSISSNETAEISIYPNPNNGMFYFSFGNVNGNVNYQIYDTKGSIITDKYVKTNGNTVEEISVKFIPGVYYVKVITNNQTYVEKLVIE